MAKSLPPTDDGDADEAIGSFVAEFDHSVIGFITNGRRIHIRQETEIKDVGEDIIMI